MFGGFKSSFWDDALELRRCMIYVYTYITYILYIGHVLSLIIYTSMYILCIYIYMNVIKHYIYILYT